MSKSQGYATRGAVEETTSNLASVMATASGLVAANVLLMLVLSYTPVATLGQVLFSNFFLGIGTFVVTVGGGYWLARKGLDRDSMPLAGVGVLLAQFGYGLFGAALLAGVGSALRVPALGITALITALITAVVTLVVFKTDHSFERWQLYAGGLFVGGFAVGAVGFFVAPTLMLVAGLCFFLGFLADLTYEIWAVKVSRYPGTLRNAIGIYVAVMGVFVHVLQWVLRALEMVDQ